MDRKLIYSAEEPLLNVIELSNRLKISRSLVFRLMAEGKIPFLKIGGATRFIYSQVIISLSEKFNIERSSVA